MVHWLSQKLSKLLIIENLQTAATGDFADCGGMEPMMVVAVPTLHKNTAVAKTFRIHFPTNIIEMNTCEEKVDKDIRWIHTVYLLFMLCLQRDVSA